MYTGNLAPQLKSGITIIVAILSKRDFSERVAIIAGTEHPKPSSIGITLEPLSPKRRITLSQRNAARAMYPLSSRIESARNSNATFGRNTNTPPTPPITPSTSSFFASGKEPSGPRRRDGVGGVRE